MRCEVHGSPVPCTFCEWAASGLPRKVRGAAARAARVADPSYSTNRPISLISEPPLEPRFTWLKHMTTCPARVRHGCGCNGLYQCRVREYATVRPDDCRQCIQARSLTD